MLLLVLVSQWVALSVFVSWGLHKNEQALRLWCLELRKERANSWGGGWSYMMRKGVGLAQCLSWGSN